MARGGSSRPPRPIGFSFSESLRALTDRSGSKPAAERRASPPPTTSRAPPIRKQIWSSQPENRSFTPKTASRDEAEVHDGPLDHLAFPHIMDAIIAHPDSWLAMRATCRAYRDRVDKLLYEHIVITPLVYSAGDSDGHHEDVDDYNDDDEDDIPPPLTLDVAATSHRLPAFPPRQYRNTTGKLLRCATLLQNTRVVDLPMGIPQQDLMWFVNMKSIQIARFHYDPDVGVDEDSVLTTDWVTNQIKPASTVVLIPGPRRPKTSSDLIKPPAAYLNRSYKLDTVVSNVLYWPPKGPIHMDAAIAHGMCKHVVLIFHCLPWLWLSEFPNNLVGSPLAAQRWDKLATSVFGWLMMEVETITVVDMPTDQFKGSPVSTKTTSHDFLEIVRYAMGIRRPIFENHVSRIRMISREQWEDEVGPEAAKLQAIGYWEGGGAFRNVRM